MAFQRPMAIPGVKMADFLRHAATNVRHPERKEGEELIPMREFRKELKGKMEQLRMDPEFARRYVNDGFSGGEMKRAEILQLAMLRPKFAILDETDSGSTSTRCGWPARASPRSAARRWAFSSSRTTTSCWSTTARLHARDAGRPDRRNRRHRVGASCTEGYDTHRRLRSASGDEHPDAAAEEAESTDAQPNRSGVSTSLNIDMQVRPKRKQYMTWLPKFSATDPPASAKSTNTISTPIEAGVQGPQGARRRDRQPDFGDEERAGRGCAISGSRRWRFSIRKPMPKWGGNIGLDFQDIYYYLKPADHQGKTWDDVPEEIKKTFDRLGIPEAEKKFLSGVKAQFESEVVYGSLQEDLAQEGRDLHRHRFGGPRASRSGAASISPRSFRRTTTSSPRSTRPSGRAARSSTCPRA